jgi:hypothetical protein
MNVDTQEFKIKADVELQNSNINKYYTELHQDMNVTILNIRDRSLSVSSIRSKWLMYLFKEKENLKRLKDAKSNKMKIMMDTLNKDPNHRTIINKKLEDKINTEDVMIKINNAIETTKEVVQFLEFATNILNDYGFTVKNALDCLKLEQI